MLKKNLSKASKGLRNRKRVLLLAVPCLVVLTLYIVSERELEWKSFLSLRAFSEDNITDSYLVWNPKCHMVSKDPMDPTIKKFVIKHKFEACSSEPLMSYVTRDPTTGSIELVVKDDVRKTRSRPTCCWTPIVRPVPSRPPKGDWDTKISVGKCVDFVKRVVLPPEMEIAMVTCRRGKATTYKNIHAIINPEKVRDRLRDGHANETKSRKLSVLVLGIDSVSRLNFKRNMPRTEKYLRDNDWFHLEGYNKMGENTFPNLMAILTGQNVSEAYKNCKPLVPYGFDDCPMLWYNFRNASYATAYGEELAATSTFNYYKVGFVEPPTDYYLRPYIVATEKLLKGKRRFNNKYCTGPEISFERMFNYALEFSRTFVGLPYFGFFWTNTVSHGDVNGISSMDERSLDVLSKMEAEGIMNDTMIVFLSDHGMRWGGIRQTFVGWYEERLPFIYIKLPDWFRSLEPGAYEALRVNEHRLTSPYDLYETFREILTRAGGEATASTGCPTCRSLFHPVPSERGCSDAGISPHWCTCMAFATSDNNDRIAVEGSHKFLEHVENIVKNYRSKSGKRLCAKLKLKKIIRVDRVIEPRHFDNSRNATLERAYFYLLEVTPGDGRYEATIYYHGGDNYTVNEDEISRINSYASNSRCLDHGAKRYCHCLKK